MFTLLNTTKSNAYSTLHLNFGQTQPNKQCWSHVATKLSKIYHFGSFSGPTWTLFKSWYRDRSRCLGTSDLNNPRLCISFEYLSLQILHEPVLSTTGFKMVHYLSLKSRLNWFMKTYERIIVFLSYLQAQSQS